MNDIRFRPKYISFDCYGTLIYYDIATVTRELIGDRLTTEQFDRFIVDFRAYRYDQILGDFYPYQQVLADAFGRTCRKWGLEPNPDAGQKLAAAVRGWGPHTDVPEPLKKMGENFPLVILSNADNSFLDVSVPKLGADFHAVYTAEQAGYYKPRLQAFEYMFDTLGARPEEILHISSHMLYDLVPAEWLGMKNKVMLDRGYDPLNAAYNYEVAGDLNVVNKLLGL
jgi:2-haloacid dehalogenase